jgi:hypothetical protein
MRCRQPARTRRWWAALRALALGAAWLARPAPACAAFADRPLAEALAALQQQGLALIFSSDLVRPEMRVRAEPKGRTRRELLDALLAEHGLAATAGPGGTLLVVRAVPVARSVPGSLATSLPEAPLVADTAHFEETVEVMEATGRRESLAPSFTVRPAEVMGVAGAAENIFRVVQTLPGVIGLNELEGRVSVRGGGPDENLTVMDGVEIHNPYRLLGLASAFNPETIESFELVTGAFHPRYGDRLSSVLVVDARGGTRERRLAGAAALSLTDANLVLEGRLPGLRDASWLLAGRRSYYDLVLGDDALPSFDDLQLKTSWEPRPGARVTLLALRSRERSIFQRGFSDEFKLRSRNDLVSARVLLGLGTRGTWDSVAAFYGERDRMGFRDEFRDLGGGGEGSNPLFSEVAVGRDVSIEDFSLRQELGYAVSARHRLGAGFDVHAIRTGVAWRVADDLNGGLVVAPWRRPEGEGTLDAVSIPTRLRGGVWLGDHFEVSPRLSLDAGLRLERGGITPRTTLSPRLSARLRVDSSTLVEAALGMHAQSTGFEKFLQRDFLFDARSLFDLSQGSDRLRNERALHAVVSLDRSFRAGLAARACAFYKHFDDLVVPRLETEAERVSRLLPYDFPETLRGDVPTDPQITRIPTNDGSGRAYGLELLLSRKPSGPFGRLSGWISYTLLKTDREAFGVRSPFDYDRRHSLTVVAVLRPWPSVELSATARWSSGLPWTPALRTRVSAVADVDDRDGDGDRSELVPRRAFEGGRYAYDLDFGGLDNRNSARGPAYARLDMRLSMRPHGRDGRWTFYLDVINVLRRRNPTFLYSTVGVDPITQKGVVENGDNDGNALPLVPSLGVRFRF